MMESPRKLDTSASTNLTDCQEAWLLALERSQKSCPIEVARKALYGDYRKALKLKTVAIGVVIGMVDEYEMSLAEVAECIRSNPRRFFHEE